MNIVFFAHPDFLQHQSMPRYAQMLAMGMKERGHQVEVWSPAARVVNFSSRSVIKKWLGYIDQYILFPREIRTRLQSCHPETLFVFTDHALGPWVPLVADKPHVVHCHDFLAQCSALGEIEENKTAWTGRLYQAFIRNGYSKAAYFISVSKQSKLDLHRLISKQPALSQVVYNGLNQPFEHIDDVKARNILSERIHIDLRPGYLLHIGGNMWYKNRTGVLEIYNAWRSWSDIKLPLLMIGESPSENILNVRDNSPFGQDIHFLKGLDDETVRLAYAGASVFLFPSLNEGFGWPIAEAMASGCPVITTDRAPMTEVAGTAAFLIPRRPPGVRGAGNWAAETALLVDKVIRLSPEERMQIAKKGLMNSVRFDPRHALDEIEKIYDKVLQDFKEIA